MKLSANLDINRYEWVKQLLPEYLKKSPSTVVADIGSGTGVMRAPIESAGGIWQGFDLEPQLPEITSWDLDYSVPAEIQEKAGVVLLMDVVEHLNNPWNAFKHISEHMLPGGYLFLTTPNPRWSRSRWFQLMQGDLICFQPIDLELNHHVFTPWPHILERLLLDNDLEPQLYITLDGKAVMPGAPYNHRYPVRYLFYLMNKWIEGRDPSACGMSLAILARKRGGAK
jgi:SAM-dependent methyltransferase